MVSLFCRCQRHVDELVVEVDRLRSQLKNLDVEMGTLQDHVRKWMRRAIAAERAAGVEAGGEVAPRSAPATGVSPPARLTLRERRAARVDAKRRARANGQALQQDDGDTDLEVHDGLHS